MNIVCPITSSKKRRPYYVPIKNEALNKKSKVNTKQVYSLYYTEKGECKVQVIGNLEEKGFVNIVQQPQ